MVILSEQVLYKYYKSIMEAGLERERAFIERQVILCRKWHSLYYFIRYLVTGKD